MGTSIVSPANQFATFEAHTTYINVRRYKIYIYELKSFFRLFGVEFGLSTNGDSSTDSDCDTAVELNAAVVSRDYLLIPNGRINGADGDVIVFATKYCGNSLLNREVIGESTEFSSARIIKYVLSVAFRLRFRLDSTMFCRYLYRRNCTYVYTHTVIMLRAFFSLPILSFSTDFRVRFY